MSDWEDEYDQDGVAIYKPATKPAPADWKFSCNDQERENVVFGVKNGTKFGAPRKTRANRSGPGPEVNKWGGGGPGRQTTFSKEVSSRPLTITVETTSIGRVIGRGGATIRELQESSGARIKINKGGYEGEVVIFGSTAAQQKAKEMIEDLVAEGNSRYCNGSRRGQEYEGRCGGEKNGSVWSTAELQASNVVQDWPSIDWDLIRENKEKYKELKWKDIPPIKKKFYTEAPSVAVLTAEEVGEWRAV